MRWISFQWYYWNGIHLLFDLKRIVQFYSGMREKAYRFILLFDLKSLVAMKIKPENDFTYIYSISS